MKKEYTKEKLKKAVLNCNTLRQVLLFFNRNQSSNSYKILNKKIKEWDIDISHFLNRSEAIKKNFSEGKLKKLNNNVLFVENSFCARNTLKKRIIEEELIEYKCFKCNNVGEWMGEKITLILDHINGVNNDNRIENLRFACPNCNSTLETHCLGYKKINYKEKEINKNNKTYIYRPRINKRKVDRPSLEQLLKDVKENSYRAVARKYGVSDVLIRKWILNYGEIPPKKHNKK